MKPLPIKFTQNMKTLFDEYLTNEDYDLFIQSFSDQTHRGIRFNSLKISERDEFLDLLKQMYKDFGLPASFEPVLWSDDGFYLEGEFFPGRHFLYNTGIFYIQEPSAMLPAFVLNAKPKEIILDLCAAPGGKTVKIAADMKGEGILFSNDINETRVKALVRNVELMGCTNCVVLNESPEHLAMQMPGYFDKILLDAPCSGEGMFRRDSDAIMSWENFGNDACVKMQREILHHVDKLLKPGGVLVYSTCTFSTLENEEMIKWFCLEYPWFEVVPITNLKGVDHGLSIDLQIKGTARIFPHYSKGEGHFCAKLFKNPLPESLSDKIESENAEFVKNSPKASAINIYTKTIRNNRTKNDKSQEKYQNKVPIDFNKEQFINAFITFSNDVLTSECVDKVLFSCNQHLQIISGHVYTLPQEIPALNTLKIAKKGLYLGELKSAKSKIIFEPSHSFLLSRTRTDLKNSLSFDASDPILLKYLKGETISCQIPDSLFANSYIPICVQGFPVGWGKIMESDMIKNLYPQGWRKN